MRNRDRRWFVERAERLAPAAQAAQRKWGCPASVLLAQALTQESNTKSPQSLPYWRRIFLAHAMTIATDLRYGQAMEKAGNPLAFVAALDDLGYCGKSADFWFNTSNLIQSLDLQKYDVQIRKGETS